MARYVPSNMMLPSPLAGLGDATATLADAIIKSRERESLNNDYTLIGQALGKLQSSGIPQEGVSSEGDPYTIPAQNVDIQTLAQETLPQMKTPQGKMALIQALIQNKPQPVYAMENGQLVQKGSMPPGAKMISTPPGSGPKVIGNRLVGPDGRVLYEAPKDKTILMTPQGPVEIEANYKETTAYKEGVKRFKPEILVPNTGKGEPVMWEPGTPLPKGYVPFSRSTTQMGPETITSLLDGIESGRIPPSMPSKRGANYNQLLGAASERGLDLSGLEIEYQGAKKATTAMASAMNSTQRTNFLALSNSIVNSIDEVKKLSQQMDLSGFHPANYVELKTLSEGAGNTPKGQLATKYLTAINFLKEEVAQMAQGGYAPTEPAFKLANQQLNSNFGVKQMDAGLSQLQRMINYRKNAFQELRTETPSGGRSAMTANAKVNKLQAQYNDAKARVAAMPPGPAKQQAEQQLEQRRQQYGL